LHWAINLYEIGGIHLKQNKKRAALITGSGRRIGAAIATALADTGWFVYLHCHTSSESAIELLNAIQNRGGDGKVIFSDLSAPDCVDQITKQLEIGVSPLELLVNNAAMFEYDNISNIDSKSIDEHFYVNVRAPVLISRYFFEQTSPQGGGCIINILDNKIFSINPDYLSYTISKVALQGATNALAMAMAPKVRVNGIAPGITLESDSQGADSFKRGQTMSPLGKVSSIEDIVKGVLFILDTESLNGHVITIDGGQNLQRLERDVAFL